MSTDLKEKKTETAGEINARDAYPYRFLGAINSPEDLRKLSSADLPLLAAELRHFIVNSVSQTGGHLASRSRRGGACRGASLCLQYPRMIRSSGMWGIRLTLIRSSQGGREAMADGGRSGRRAAFRGSRSAPKARMTPLAQGTRLPRCPRALGMAVASYLQGATERWACRCDWRRGRSTGGMAIEALNDAGSLEGSDPSPHYSERQQLLDLSPGRSAFKEPDEARFNSCVPWSAGAVEAGAVASSESLGIRETL